MEQGFLSQKGKKKKLCTKVSQVVDFLADFDAIVAVVQWSREMRLFTVPLQNLLGFLTVTPLIHPRSEMEAILKIAAVVTVYEARVVSGDQILRATIN